MPTKLLLVQDVEDLGRSGDVVSVKPGFARNFLIPQGFAFVADKRTLRMQARLQQERAIQAAEDRREAEAQATQLQDISLTAIVKVDPEGHMYGSVTAHDVARLLGEQASIGVEKKAVQLKHAIKVLGAHRVVIRLKEGVEASVTVKVMTEDGRMEPPKGKEEAELEVVLEEQPPEE